MTNQNNKFIGYARDDIFIISINNSADRIEECEAKIYLEPRLIFVYFGLISALYSKIHKYIEQDLSNDIINIRNKLYNENILDDIKSNNINNKTKIQFINILDSLINIYRLITDELPNTSLFPVINIKPNIKINKSLTNNKNDNY
jgi:hypothetical protein